MSKDKKDFKNITLDELARMMAGGFSNVYERISGLDGRMDILDGRMDVLEEKVEQGFVEMHAHLNNHAKAVYEQTDSLAHRVKKLEEKVF